MCKALQDLYDEGVERGIERGMERGMEHKIFELVKKKLTKGKNASEIANELEESEARIQEIINRIQKENH